MTDRARYRLGLFATPCGGTVFVAQHLRRCGVDVGHEKLRRDGIVCGWWALGHEPAPDDQPKAHLADHEWDVLGVVARHPLLVAETLPTYSDRRRHHAWTHPDPVVHALRYWVETHEAAWTLHLGGGADLFETAAVVRIDSHLGDDLDALCDALGSETRPLKPPPPGKPRRWPRWTWAQWRAADPSYAARGRELVRQLRLEEPP